MDLEILLASFALVAGIGILIYRSFHRRNRWVLNENNWNPNPDQGKEIKFTIEINGSNLKSEEESSDHAHST